MKLNLKKEKSKYEKEKRRLIKKAKKGDIGAKRVCKKRFDLRILVSNGKAHNQEGARLLREYRAS